MITQPTVPVAGESLAEAGQRIRDAIPICAHTASEDECVARRLAIDATLAARRVWHKNRQWHTAQLADGQIVGVSARSTEEAELDLTVWFAQPCHWVIADPALAVRGEYFPAGIRRARDVGRVFPLCASPASPRRVRARRLAPRAPRYPSPLSPTPAEQRKLS